MVTIEEKARELFEEGKSAREVYEILFKSGDRVALSTIKKYYTAWKKRFNSYSEYRKELARKKRINRDYEYKGYMRDPHFREIFSNGQDGIREDNPYFLASKYLESGEPEIEEKLEEIIAGMGPRERIRYIGRLKRGVEILKKAGKI